MGTKFFGDYFYRWLDDAMTRITGQMRQCGASERPAGPGPPAALLAAGFIHATGQVLKMHARIADENTGRSFLQQPDNGGVGQRPAGEHGFVAMQIGEQRAIKAKDGTGGETATP